MIEYEYIISIRDLVDRANELKLNLKDMLIIKAPQDLGYLMIYQTKEKKGNG